MQGHHPILVVTIICMLIDPEDQVVHPNGGSHGTHAPHSMPYDYHHRGPYSSQGSHYSSPGYGGYLPQHMPPRGGYGPGWDQRPLHSGRKGAQTSGPVPPPSGHAPSPALGGPPPSQVNYCYGQSHGPEYGHAAAYSQTGHQQTYGQMNEQQKYDNNPPMQPPYGGYPATGGGQPGYSQMQQPGMQQGPVQQEYGPPRPVAAASSGEVPYQSATPAPAAATTIAPQQQQYGYTSTGGPVQQQTYPFYSSAPTSVAYNNGTQTPPATGPAYQQQSVQPASSTHDQLGAQQAAAAGYGGQVAPTGGYSSYPSSQPSYCTTQTQIYGYNTRSQDPNYGYGAAPGSQPAYSQAAPGSQPVYSHTAPTQAGYEQQTASQAASYAAAPGNAQVKTQSPQSAYAHYDASQVYSAPR